MNSIQRNRAILDKFQYTFLAEAEQVFGPKTQYGYEEITFDNQPPRVVSSKKLLNEGIEGYQIILCARGLADLTDGIFQLSHEVVHLLSPVELRKGDEINYLEEGMATWFSKLVTERETGQMDFCMPLIDKTDKYLKAYQLYLELLDADPSAVKKLRQICQVVARIRPEHFLQAGIAVDQGLVNELLVKFPND